MMRNKTPVISPRSKPRFNLTGRVERVIPQEKGPALHVVSYAAPQPGYSKNGCNGPATIDPDHVTAWLFERAVEEGAFLLLLELLDGNLGSEIAKHAGLGLGWQSDSGHRVMLLVNDAAADGLLGLLLNAAMTVTTEAQARRFGHGWTSDRAAMRQLGADLEQGGCDDKKALAKRLAKYGLKLTGAVAADSVAQKSLKWIVDQVGST